MSVGTIATARADCGGVTSAGACWRVRISWRMSCFVSCDSPSFNCMSVPCAVKRMMIAAGAKQNMMGKMSFIGVLFASVNAACRRATRK